MAAIKIIGLNSVNKPLQSLYSQTGKYDYNNCKDKNRSKDK